MFSNRFRFETGFFSSSDEYQHIIKVAEKLLAPLGLDFLQFSLSLRYYSLRVELFNRVSIIILVMVFLIKALCNFEKPLTVHQYMYLMFQVQMLRITC